MKRYILHFAVALCVLGAPLLLVILSVSKTNVGAWSFELTRYQSLFGNEKLALSLLSTIAMSAAAGTIGAIAGILFATICYFKGKLRVAIAMSLIAAVIPGEATALGFLKLQSFLGIKQSSTIILIWSLAHYSGAFCGLLMSYVAARTDASVIRSECDIGGNLVSAGYLFLVHIHGWSVLAIGVASVLFCAIEFPRTSMLSGSTEYLSEYFFGQLRSGAESSTFALAGATILIYLLLGVLAMVALQRGSRTRVR